jgi:selenocysteine lyase/cysteine desulfurase
MSNDFRAEFDIPRDICYLNAAYMTPQPRRVVEAAMRGTTRRSQPWRITPADFFSEVEALRAAFAQQIGCSADNVAIVPSASYGVSCAAANLPIKRGDVILALQDQFPSNYYSWRRQALATDAEFHVVSKDESQTWADALLDAIELRGNDIAIATLEGHHWTSGEVVDLEVVIAALREVGARVVLDLTQTRQFCPYGVAFLYVDDNYFEGVPIEEAWMGRDGAEDFSRLVDFTDQYQPGARRFDAGEKSSFPSIAGALAALQMLAEWGIGNISEALAVTNARIAEILAGRGFETMATDVRAPHFQGARLPATDPRTLAAHLIDNGVYASVRGDHLRVAPHLYTDDEDLACFDDALRTAIS